MFGIGGPELIFILVLALLIFGPKKLPQIGRTLGKGMAEFRKASTELQRAINAEIEDPSSTPATRRPALLAEAAAAVTPAAAPAAAAPATPVSAAPIEPGSGRVAEHDPAASS